MEKIVKKDIVSQILKDHAIQQWIEKEIDSSDSDINKEVSERMFSAIKKECVARPTKVRSMYNFWLKWAAVIVLPMCVSLLTFYALNSLITNNNSPLVVKAEKGDKAQISLPDGTKVVLNSLSNLSYDHSFGDDERCVYLNGEAYFQVAHNKNCPFIVKAGGLDVKVLGTSFNLSAYEDDEQIEVVLLEGKVDVLTPHQSYIMKPGSKVCYNKNTHTLHTSEVHSTDYIEWTKGNLYFEHDSLSNIMKVLSRIYNVEIQFQSEQLPKKYFSGTIPGNSIKSAMDILQLTAGFDYAVEDSVIVIKDSKVNRR